MLARITSWLDRAAFSPDSLPDDLVFGVAVTPSVIAGIVIFRLPAVEMLLIALAAGIIGQLASRFLWRTLIPKPETSPIVAAVVGMALVGAGTPLLVSAEVVVLAVALEILRARYTPAVHAQAGLISWAIVTLANRGATLRYLNPNGGNPLEPFGIWRLFPPGAAPIDPIRLYVGNVPGPVFATSLMAVAVGIAWLAYARRLSPVVAVCFLLGALVPIALFRWDFVFQLDSGPMWFVAGLILSDRRTLPSSWAIRPILGFAAGAISVGLRNRGIGIEGSLFTVAAAQALTGIAVVLIWAVKNTSRSRERTRLLRRRDEQLRAINQVEEPADPTAA